MSKTSTKNSDWDFPGSSVVENLPWSAGDMGSIPGQGTKILQAMEKLSPRARTGESMRHNGSSHMLQLRPTQSNKYKYFFKKEFRLFFKDSEASAQCHSVPSTWSGNHRMGTTFKTLSVSLDGWTNHHCSHLKSQSLEPLSNHWYQQ